MAKSMTDQILTTKVVVYGDGLIGTSVAYHLAQRGWTDVVLLNKGRLASKINETLPDLLGPNTESVDAIKIFQYARNLMKSFEEQGYVVGWKQFGSLEIATKQDRLIVLKRKQSILNAVEIESLILKPKEIKDKWPWINTDDIFGGLWIPEDGRINVSDTVLVLSQLAKEKGVKIIEDTDVKNVITCEGKVSQVCTTSQEVFNCWYFVDCTGMRSRDIGKSTIPPIKVPLRVKQHHYLLTNQIQELGSHIPAVRDADGLLSFWECTEGLLVDGFELPEETPAPDDTADGPNLRFLSSAYNQATVGVIHRIPTLKAAQFNTSSQITKYFSLDKNWILGESAEIQNYFLATGMNTGAIMKSGIGKYIAEWIIDGVPSIDLTDHDIHRFPPHANNFRFLSDRVEETKNYYSIKYPHETCKSCRNIRRSPLHYKQEAAGAVFGEINSYERADWFRLPGEYHEIRTFKKPVWCESVKKEYLACKETVGIMDMSSISKTEVKSFGRQSVDFLQKLCCNDIDQGIGVIIRTGMLNEVGGYHIDCVVIQMLPNHFFVQSSQSQQTRSSSWFNKHKPNDGSVEIRNVTSNYTAVNLIGPNAPKLLADLTDISTSLDDFKPMTFKVIDIGYASGVCAMRHTYSGEDGFLLYVPSEYVLHVYDVLMEAGQKYGICNVGHIALRMLQIENCIVSWGQELGSHTTPFECCYLVNVDKSVDFIGKESLLKQKESGIFKQLVQITVQEFHIDTEIWPTGGESIFRKGIFCGTILSVGYSYKLDKIAGLAFIQDQKQRQIGKEMNDFINDIDAEYKLNIAGKLFPLIVKLCH